MKLLAIKYMLKKLAAKGVHINPTDIMTQTNVDDVLALLKELLL